MNGPDREKWIMASQKEENSIDSRVTVEFLPGGWNDVPKGTDVMPIVKNYRIKDDGIFKCRAFVLGNLEKYIGDRYAPTISKAVM